MLMLAAILSLLSLPYTVKTEVRSSDFRPLMQFAFWLFVATCFILGWIATKPVEHPFLIVGQVATFAYFFLLLFVFPSVGRLEHFLSTK